MRVRRRQVDWSSVPSEVAPYEKESQAFLTVGSDYEVHAIAMFSGFPFFHVVNDLGNPTWKSGWLFDLIEGTLPTDWVCNLLHGDPCLLMGPEFVVRDEAAYEAMVELDPEQVDRFWKRVRSVSAAEGSDE